MEIGFSGLRTYSIYETLEGSIALQRWGVLILPSVECDLPLSLEEEEVWRQGVFMLTKCWLKFVGWLSGLSESNWKANCIISFEKSLKMFLLHIPVAPCGSFHRGATPHNTPPTPAKSCVISCGYWSFPVSSIQMLVLFWLPWEWVLNYELSFTDIGGCTSFGVGIEEKKAGVAFRRLGAVTASLAAFSWVSSSMPASSSIFWALGCVTTVPDAGG